jgi:hypothetical protein
MDFLSYYNAKYNSQKRWETFSPYDKEKFNLYGPLRSSTIRLIVATKDQTMSEAHKTPYLVHPGAFKMYQDLWKNYRWPNMKNKVTEFVSKCLTCQKVKTEHRHPGGDLQKNWLKSTYLRLWNCMEHQNQASQTGMDASFLDYERIFILPWGRNWKLIRFFTPKWPNGKNYPELFWFSRTKSFKGGRL